MRTINEMARGFSEVAKEKYPEVWSKHYPRRIIPPTGFTNPTAYAMLAAGSEIAVIEKRLGVNDVYARIITAHDRASKFKMPMFFVDEAFCQDIAKTEPMEDLKISELNMPLDSMIVALPHEFSAEHFGRVVHFIGCHSILAGEYRIHNLSIDVQRDGTLFYALVDDDNLIACEYVGLTYKDENVGDMMKKEFVANTEVKSSISREDDKVIMDKIQVFMTNILTALTAEPKWIETEPAMSRPNKIKNGRIVKEALWNPNFIGRHYGAQREARNGQAHSSPHIHWRIGHMRRQRYGEGRTQVRVIWIKPVLVGAKKEEVCK